MTLYIGDPSVAEGVLAGDPYTPASQTGDTTPDPFTLGNFFDVAPLAEVFSNTVVVSGIDAPSSISVTNGQYRINGGALTSSPGLVNNGDLVEAYHIAAAAGQTLTDTTLNIGGVTDVMSSTTRAVDDLVDQFDLGDLSGQTPGATDLLANLVTVSGMDSIATVTVSVIGDSTAEFSINGGNYQTFDGTVQNGDTVQLRMDAPGSSNSSTQATLSIGAITDVFTISTTITASPGIAGGKGRGKQRMGRVVK